jgi:glycine cleavage system H lipoate-binding protein
MTFRLATIARHLTKKPRLYPIRRFGISRILKSKTPENYSHEYYWLKNINENQYAFGITKEFIEDHGYPQMIFLEAEIDDVLMEGDSFAVIENEKSVVSIEVPFDNAKLIHLDEDVDFDIINEDSVNIENKLCVFENVDNSDKTDSGANMVIQN